MKIRDRIVELRRVKGAELLPNPKNWRDHPKEQKQALQYLLETVGFAGALAARVTDEGIMLIDGHLRKKLADDQDVPVLILDVTEEEADLLLASYDPIAGMAKADKDLLAKLTASLDIQSQDLAKQLDKIAPPPVDGLGDGGSPEEPEEAVSQEGDVWLCGDHRVMCGDSTDEATVARLLDGQAPMLMVTDPPYGVEYDSSWRVEQGMIAEESHASGEVKNDNRADWSDAYAAFGAQVAYVWHASLHAREVMESLVVCGFEHKAQIIWSKPYRFLSRGDYHWQHEPCWYAVQKGKKHNWQGNRSETTLWEIGRGCEEKTGHSTEKPVECMARPIRNNTAKGELVCDPFLGSGTTLVAAEQLARPCCAMELHPPYVDISLLRWHNLTEQEPVLESTGQTFSEVKAERLG